MKSTTSLIESRWILALMFVVGGVLAFVRLFAYLMFADTAPLWVAAPAVVMVALLANCLRQNKASRKIVGLGLVVYGLSFALHGYGNLASRDFDDSVFFDVLEAAVILFASYRTYLLSTPQAK